MKFIIMEISLLQQPEYMLLRQHAGNHHHEGGVPGFKNYGN